MTSLPPPTMKFPPGYVNEFAGDKLYNTAIAFMVLQILFVMLRGWARHHQDVKFMYGDIIIPISLVTSLVVDAVCLVAIERAGLGRHTDVMASDPGKLKLFYQLTFYVIPVFWILASNLPKLAILDIFLMIFVDKTSRGVCYLVGVVLICSPIINIFVVVFQCRPTSYMWLGETGSCHDIHAHFLFASLPNIVTDVVMLVLPLPTVWKLQTSRKIKLGLVVTFSLGLFALIASILRFVAFVPFSSVSPFSKDIMWYAAEWSCVWLIVEPGIYIIVACLMTLRSLMVYIVYQSPLPFGIRRSGQFTTGGHAATKSSPRHGNPSDVESLDLALDAGGHQHTFVTSNPSTHRHTEVPLDGIKVDHEIRTTSSAV